MNSVCTFRANLCTIYLVPKVSNICYERIIESGFCVLYVNRLNGYLFTMQSKGLYKNLIMDLDNFNNSQLKLRKYWCRSLEHMGRKCQILCSKMPLEVSEVLARNITVLVLSSCTCSIILVVSNTADNRWSNDPNLEPVFCSLVLKPSFQNIANGNESICTSVSGRGARMEGQK